MLAAVICAPVAAPVITATRLRGGNAKSARGAVGFAAEAIGTARAAATLFNPLRQRVQRAVDRRFNRTRYDADATVADFAARLKDAVDPDAVRDDLTGTVQRALEPAHVSVWTSSGAGA